MTQKNLFVGVDIGGTHITCAAVNLAECLAPRLKTFGAEVLVIGGNIAHALPLFEAVFRDGLQQADVSVNITPSTLLKNAALLGSARLLDDDFWERVSVHLLNI